MADGTDPQLAPGEGHRAHQRLARPMVSHGCLLEERQTAQPPRDSPNDEIAPVVLAAVQRAELPFTAQAYAVAPGPQPGQPL